MQKSGNLAFREKLHSERGASLIIALLFFLVCIMVASVIVTAAAANMGRIDKQREEEQVYFAVSSAARMLQDDFADMSVLSASKTDITYTCPYGEHADSEGVWDCTDKYGTFTGSTGAALAGYVNDAVVYLLRYQSAPPTEAFTITPDLPELSGMPVSVKLALSTDYVLSLVVTAATGKGASYAMSLSVAGNMAESSFEDATRYCTHREQSNTPVLVNGEWVYPMIDNTYPIVETTHVVTVTWSRGTISKGE